MSSNKITSSNGTASTDVVNLGQVQSLVVGVGASKEDITQAQTHQQ